MEHSDFGYKVYPMLDGVYSRARLDIIRFFWKPFLDGLPICRMSMSIAHNVFMAAKDYTKGIE